LEGLAVGVCVVDLERRITIWSDGAESITGYRRHEVIGHCYNEEVLIHRDENDEPLTEAEAPLFVAMREGTTCQKEVFLSHKEGHRIPATARAVAVRDEGGSIIGGAESFEERTLPDPDIAFMPRCPAPSEDAPTSLLSPQITRLRLEEALRQHYLTQLPFGLLSIAVDGLEEQKRMLGKSAGDAILRVTANSLRKTLRPADVLGAWDDNSFLVIAAHCPATAIKQAGELLRKMVSVETVSWWGDTVPVRISVGGTVSEFGDTPSAILSRSEAALRTSISKGGDCVTIL
jgi:diguanylate cyclase (GGDEF)-like protein/PAS domain S-box-containing protein